MKRLLISMTTLCLIALSPAATPEELKKVPELTREAFQAKTAQFSREQQAFQKKLQQDRWEFEEQDEGRETKSRG